MVIDNTKLNTVIKNLKVNLKDLELLKYLNDDDRDLIKCLSISLEDVMTIEEYKKLNEQ